MVAVGCSIVGPVELPKGNECRHPDSQGQHCPNRRDRSRIAASSRRRGWTGSPEEVSTAGVLVDLDLTAGETFVEDLQRVWTAADGRRLGSSEALTVSLADDGDDRPSEDAEGSQ